MKFLRIPFPQTVEVPARLGSQVEAMPVSDWVYFATPSQASRVATKAFVTECQLILRSAYNSTGAAIANARRIKLGDRILLVYGGGNDSQPYRPMFLCRAIRPPRPVPEFEAFSFADEASSKPLELAGYPRDPILKRFTGISSEILQDLDSLHQPVVRPGGINAIHSGDKVFPRGTQP